MQDCRCINNSFSFNKSGSILETIDAASYS